MLTCLIQILAILLEIVIVVANKSNSVAFCIKDERYASDTLLYDVNTVRKSFEKKLGQPPKHIYRVPNLKAASLLQKAVVNGDIQQVKKLLTRAVDLSRKWSNGDTPLSYSATKSNLAMTEFLLENGADPNQRDRNDNTPLQFALEEAHIAAVYQAWNKVQKYYKIAYLLLVNEADPNIKDHNGRTPLHFAVETQDTTMTEFLLVNGADPNRQDTNGKTPLHLAVDKNDKSNAELLLQYKADPNRQDEKGETPLFLDVRRAYLKQDNGMAALLLAYHANPNIPNNSGDVALYWAAEIIQSKEMTKLLINNGANPDIIKVGSQHLSLYWTVAISQNKEMTKLLVEKGANLNCFHKYYSPSYLVRKAIISGDKDDVQFFVQYGSFVDLEIQDASNLLEYALMNGHKEMAAIILQNMSDKIISEPLKGPLLDPILTKMIKSTPNPHKIKSEIARLSELLEIFTVYNPNLTNQEFLFGNKTLPLLEKLYNLYLCPNTLINENIPGSRIINSRGLGIKKLFNKALPKQEEINDVPADPVQGMLKHNFKGFIYHFMQVVPITEDALEKYPSINELYISTRQLKSACRDVVPLEQSPEFAKTLLENVPIVHNDQAQVNNWLSLSGHQDPEVTKD